MFGFVCFLCMKTSLNTTICCSVCFRLLMCECFRSSEVILSRCFMLLYLCICAIERERKRNGKIIDWRSNSVSSMLLECTRNWIIINGQNLNWCINIVSLSWRNEAHTLFYSSKLKQNDNSLAYTLNNNDITWPRLENCPVALSKTDSQEPQHITKWAKRSLDKAKATTLEEAGHKLVLILNIEIVLMTTTLRYKWTFLVILRYMYEIVYHFR